MIHLFHVAIRQSTLLRMGCAFMHVDGRCEMKPTSGAPIAGAWSKEVGIATGWGPKVKQQKLTLRGIAVNCKTRVLYGGDAMKCRSSRSQKSDND